MQKLENINQVVNHIIENGELDADKDCCISYGPFYLGQESGHLILTNKGVGGISVDDEGLFRQFRNRLEVLHTERLVRERLSQEQKFVDSFNEFLSNSGINESSSTLQIGDKVQIKNEFLNERDLGSVGIVADLVGNGVGEFIDIDDDGDAKIEFYGHQTFLSHSPG